MLNEIEMAGGGVGRTGWRRAARVGRRERGRAQYKLKKNYRIDNKKQCTYDRLDFCHYMLDIFLFFFFFFSSFFLALLCSLSCPLTISFTSRDWEGRHNKLLNTKQDRWCWWRCGGRSRSVEWQVLHLLSDISFIMKTGQGLLHTHTHTQPLSHSVIDRRTRTRKISLTSPIGFSVNFIFLVFLFPFLRGRRY